MQKHTLLYIFFFVIISFCAKAQDSTNVNEIDAVLIKKVKYTYKKKKDNPAYDIMQKVWEKRKTNGLDRYDSYQYREYEKIQFDVNNLDSAFVNHKAFNKLDFIFDYADSTANGKLTLPLFLNEAIYQNYGQKAPKKSNRKLEAQKTSGFQDNQIVSLTAKNFYRDINLYDNVINYFDMGFPSPVGKEGFATYRYQVTDTVYVNGQESFKINYEPKREDVLAFRGILYISTEHYGVTKATLRSTKKINVNFVNDIRSSFEYDNPDDDNFIPTKTSTTFVLSPISKKKDAKSVTATRTVNYDQYQFNISLPEDAFENEEAYAQEDQFTKDDDYWEKERPTSLRKDEQGIYDMLDRLNNTPKFTRLVKTTETLATGYYKINKAIDFGRIYSTFGFNEVEGLRIRMGARTFFSRNDQWRIEGYGAYGFKDQKFKYGAEGRFMLFPKKRFIIGAGSREDDLQLGVQLINNDGIMSRTFASSAIIGRGQNGFLSWVNQHNVFSSIELIKNLQFRVDATYQKIRSADSKLFSIDYIKDGVKKSSLRDSHLTFTLMARPGAKFSTRGIDRFEHSTLAPTLALKYIKGFEGTLGADYSYEKLQFLYDQRFFVSNWGTSNLHIEAGKNFGNLPLPLQNVIPGNQSYAIASNTFAQLNYYEFVADSFATLHYEHHFMGMILAYVPFIKKLKLREVGFFRTAWGKIGDQSKAINASSIKYSAPDDDPYFEYGFGIENIGLGNLRILRVDFNWRGNYLDRPGITKFGIKAGFQFDF